ncbi:MAG TPA: GAF domain-containing protein [Anaerolineae bacterium]
MNEDVYESLRFLKGESVRLKRENLELRQEVSMLHGVLDALRALQEVSTSIDTNTNILGLLDRILASALSSIDASDGSLMLVDEESDELVFVVVHGSVAGSLTGYRVPIGVGIAGWVAEHREAVIVPDVRFDPRFSFEVDQVFRFRTRSMVSVPIMYGDRLLGVIEALNKANGEKFNRADLTLLGVVAQLAATAMKKAETVTVTA